MKKYISTLQTKSPEHKRKFALAVSGSITLIIFGVWLFVKFNNTDGATVDNTQTASAVEAIPPIKNLTDGIADTFKSIKDAASNLSGTVKSVDLNSEYQNIKKETLPTNADSGTMNSYGQ